MAGGMFRTSHTDHDYEEEMNARRDPRPRPDDSTNDEPIHRVESSRNESKESKEAVHVLDRESGLEAEADRTHDLWVAAERTGNGQLANQAEKVYFHAYDNWKNQYPNEE
tara:strand:+ start:1101 stop:1430 length:330 start_codon:yes stop_codon:yes gene_type:complete